jgi:anti-sigma factor (TIGR02949 family)
MKVVHLGDTACEKTRRILDSYLSNELTVETNHEVLRHLEGCPACAAEVQTRARVRSRLKSAVQATAAPRDLAARIQGAVRRRRPPALERYMLAAAAVLLVCAGLLWVWGRGPGRERAILRQASVRMAAVLNVGLRDHLHCAVFRRYSKRPEDAAQMAAQLGPQFAGLVPLVKAHVPAGYRILQGHRCTVAGRRYIHLILAGDGKLASIIITRKRPGESLNGGVSQAGIDRFQVVGFDTRDYLVYVVSDLAAQQNLQMAANLAPGLREYLAGQQG